MLISVSGSGHNDINADGAELAEMQRHATVRPRVLYIVYWGAGEPLGQSLVLPAVKRLSGLGVDLTLITFEKPADLDRQEYIKEIRVGLEKNGVKWIPLRYHKRPRIPATLFDVMHGLTRSLALRLRGRFDIVHARTFIGGLMGLLIAPLIGAKLIYHNEGFYPDEQVDGGFWRAGSRPHRVAKRLEGTMYSSADAIIALSHRARREIEQLAVVRHRNTPVVVVQSCVDLRLFSRPVGARSGVVRLVYSGSVGGRYILNRVGRFIAIAKGQLGALQFQVLSPASPALVSTMLRDGGLKDGDWTIDSVPYRSMPERLAQADAGLFFLARGLSEHGCSPTKIGEYWAMGLPVITTPNVSDIDEIVERERVGVIVQGHSDEDYARAVTELTPLLADPELAQRCRRAAEEHYSLESACSRQYELYLRIMSNKTTPKEIVERGSQEAA
ncbi:MAG: glycosyltransferase family 4 protein [Acidobacteriota bacterium]